MSSTEELFVWKRTDDGEGQMWCYAGGRRYLFANLIINLKQNKCFGAIYDIDLDNLQIDLSQVNEKDLNLVTAYCYENVTIRKLGYLTKRSPLQGSGDVAGVMTWATFFESGGSYK